MGQGYTRQSSANIDNGLTINAIDLNKEFNQLQNTFNGTTGHAHDGTTGNGPKISLLSSVSGTLQPENGGLGGIHKLDATTAPSVTDDANDGYTVGSMWVDVTNDVFYICVDATPTAAVWRRSQPFSAALTSIASQTTTADRMLYTTDSNVYAVTPLTAYARSILDDANASTALSTLGVSAYIQTLLDDADAATARTTLGLGTIATQNANNVNITGGTLSGTFSGTLSTSSVNITGGVITGITDLAVADGGTGASDATGARSNLGLGNVDNTSDANKPVSTATQTALNLKANLASPALTGTPTAPTASSTTNTTQIATTAFVQSIRESLYPVGSIYINATVSTNPGTLLGFGTWTAFGAGRVPVGFNAADPLFDTAEETGGSKDAIVVAHTHTGTTNVAGNHAHSYVGAGPTYRLIWEGEHPSPNAGYANGSTSAAGDHQHSFTTNLAGSSGTNANLQPYITVYMWKRTA